MILTEEPTLAAKEYWRWYQRKADLPRSEYGKVMEDLIGKKLTFPEVMNKYDISYDQITEIISLYYKKPEIELTLTSKV